MKETELKNKERELKVSKANTNKEEGTEPLNSQNPINEIMQLYEENKFLRQQIANVNRLDIILRVLEVGHWENDFELFLRGEVKKAFGYNKTPDNENQETDHSK